MVTKGEKKKKKKSKPYDVDESKKVFLYAYEYQLLNERIDWKKAETLKITKHSAGSMRSHYLNQIKNQTSLYLEMYPEDITKLFAKVKKIKRMKKSENQTKNLSITNNFVKQTSNISLNRLTKCSSIGAGFNKMNSLSVDKFFSRNYGKNKNRGQTLLKSLGEKNKKKKKENENENENETEQKMVEEKEENKNNKKEQQGKAQKNEIKRKKIDKNKKKNVTKDVILKSSINKTHKTLATQPPKELIETSNKAHKEKKKGISKIKAKTEISKKNDLINKVEENKTKTETSKKHDLINKVEENKKKTFLESKKKDINLKENIENEKEAGEKTLSQYRIRHEVNTTEDKISALQNNIQKSKKIELNQNLESSESNVVNNIEEKKKRGITSIFGYIFKKIFK